MHADTPGGPQDRWPPTSTVTPQLVARKSAVEDFSAFDSRAGA